MTVSAGRLPLPGTPLQLVNEFSGLNRPQVSEGDVLGLYPLCATLHAAANYRAENLGMVRMKLVDKAGEPILDHPLTELLKDGIGELIKRSELALIMTGSNLLFKLRNTYNDMPMKLRWMNPRLWDSDRGLDGLRGFRVSSTENQKEQLAYIGLRDAVYMHGMDFNDDFNGVAPAAVVFIYAGIDVEMGSTVFSFFQNMAIPAMLIQPSADNRVAPTKEDLDGLVGFFKRTFRGALNTGRTLVTPARWDIQRVQAGINELSMSDLTMRAREAIFMGLQVPMELVVPGAASYSAAYEARRGWLEFWYTPRAHWYAEQLTDQLVKPINADWRVEPDFTTVPGMKDVQARRTDTVGAQINLGLMDLYTAQKTLGLEPNNFLKDIYIINGVATKPIDLSRKPEGGFQPTNKLVVGGDVPPSRPVAAPLTPAPLIPNGQPPRPETIQPDSLPPPAPRALKSETWLPDPVFRELKTWRVLVEKHGAAYPFKSELLKPEALAFGGHVLASGLPVDAAFEALKSFVYLSQGGTS